MKKNIFTLLLTIVALIVITNIFFTKRPGVASKKKVVDTVFIGPEDYKATFDKSMESSGQFYDFYRKARNSINVGDYESAIKLLNESLPYIGDGLEKGMVYKKLAEIYRIQGSFEKELFYVEQWPKYSMNVQLNEEAKNRAIEIRQILASKTPSN